MSHPINERFAQRIALRYVAIYDSEGFQQAQDYLISISKGDESLRDTLVPYIVEAGQNARK